MNHYITRYIDENDIDWVESWLQIDIFKWCYCFSIRREEIK